MPFSVAWKLFVNGNVRDFNCRIAVKELHIAKEEHTIAPAAKDHDIDPRPDTTQLIQLNAINRPMTI